jgi:hypothetical protein
MLSPAEVYPLVQGWLQAMGAVPHRMAGAALAQLVAALLVGQSLRPSALMRALLSPEAVPARQRYKRVARAWDRRWLTPGWLTPRLVPAALALVPADRDGATHLALDSVRCGAWEVFTLGVVWHGRVLPVGWAVLPYPWPTGRFTPTVCALVARVAAAWPADRPVHLVADRAFPSRALLRALRDAGWGFTLRLRAQHRVRVAGEAQPVRDRLAGADPDRWTATAAAYGAGAPDLVGTLVVGRGLAVLPAWQATPGGLRHRAARAARRQRHLASKHPRQPPDASARTDGWVVLFSTHPTWRAAVGSYRRRWGTEGSYRDAQGGWDGQHGWDLEPTLARLTDAEAVAAVVGLWALGALVQSWVGDQVGQPSAPAAVRAIRAEWTTTGRLSVWARGQCALREPSGRLRPWLADTLARGARRIAPPPPRTAPPQPAHAPTPSDRAA